MPTFALSESKLRRPAGRPGIVARPALVDRLSSVDTPAVISVVAPAGYGKTTLLAQWAESWQPRVAWVSADHRDNDPAVLLTYLATALDRVEPITPAVLRTLAFSGAAHHRRPVAGVRDRVDAPARGAGPRRRGGDHEPRSASTRSPSSRSPFRPDPGSPSHRGTRGCCRWPGSARSGGIIEIGADDLAMSEPGGGRAAQRRRRGRRRARRRRPRPTHRGLARRPLPRRAGDAGR